MDVVIVGAGALGSILGAHLAQAGHGVSLIARGRRAAQVSEHGLRISGLADIDVTCPVITDPSAVSNAELLIVTVKTYDTQSAVEALPKGAFNSVFSVANGVLKNRQLAAHFGDASVLGCMANTSGELLDDGEVKFTRNVCLHIGELDQPTSRRVNGIAQAIADSGVNALVEDDIQTIEWSKFVGWAAIFVLAVTTRAATGKFLAEANCARLAATMIREMGAIASASNIEIIDQSPVPVASIVNGSLDDGQQILMDMGRQWTEAAPGHRLSALQDLERRKRLEVEETLGFAVQEAARLNIDVPTLATCYTLIAGVNGANVASTLISA